MKKTTRGLVCVLALSAAPLLAHPIARAQYGDGPAGSIVFYSARDGNSKPQIYLMNPDGGNQFRVTFDTATDVDPDISPNGKEVVFASNDTETGNNNIFLLDRSGAVRNLTNDPTAVDEWARWSPDGRQIVFDSNRDGGIFEIYVMNADGSNTTRLTDTSSLGRYPSWSPDGRQIVFRRGINIAVINAVGSGAPRQLTSEASTSFAQMPAWSPNGQYIAFMSFREGYCSVFRMNSDGSDQINLTPKAPGDPNTSWCSRAPSWSADGQELFFMSFRPSTSGQNEIFVMDAGGADARQLTDMGTNGSPRAR
jgi:Tol biopolymer transport system component